MIKMIILAYARQISVHLTLKCLSSSISHELNLLKTKIPLEVLRMIQSIEILICDNVCDMPIQLSYHFTLSFISFVLNKNKNSNRIKCMVQTIEVLFPDNVCDIPPQLSFET